MEFSSAMCAVVLAGVAAGAVVSIVQLTNAITVYGTLLCRVLLIEPPKHLESFDDLIGYLIVKAPKLAELLVCPICLSTWATAPFALGLAKNFAWFLVVWPASVVISVAIRLAFNGADTQTFMDKHAGNGETK